MGQPESGPQHRRQPQVAALASCCSRVLDVSGNSVDRLQLMQVWCHGGCRQMEVPATTLQQAPNRAPPFAISGIPHADHDPASGSHFSPSAPTLAVQAEISPRKPVAVPGKTLQI
eukprot:3936869-Rhodomonas_salina.1